MRILMITEEEELYLPLSIHHILKHIKHHVIAVICVRNPTTVSLVETGKLFVRAFGISPLIQYSLKLLLAKMKDRVLLPDGSSRFFSVRRVAQYYHVPYQFVNDVNSRSFTNYCSDAMPDLIVSISPTQVFGRELLAIPSLGCINIHTSELPKYRGLYPVYWAMSAGERHIGISVHYMDPAIDTGRILHGGHVDTEGFTTMHEVLTKTKVEGAELMLEAIDLIDSGGGRPQSFEARDGSYFSYPTRESYKRFKARGYSLW